MNYYQTGTRILGSHVGCGGNVWYLIDVTCAVRWCDKCDQGGFKDSPAPTTEQEIGTNSLNNYDPTYKLDVREG